MGRVVEINDGGVGRKPGGGCRRLETGVKVHVQQDNQPERSRTERCVLTELHLFCNRCHSLDTKLEEI